MEKYCDNRSVGVILSNDLGQLALLKRARPPIGIAPPAGHIDSHGSPEQAAVEEVSEEVGVVLAVESLRQTAIRNRRVENVCRRIGGGYHVWDVYEAQVPYVDLKPDPDETKGAKWCTRRDVRLLANRTLAYRRDKISEQTWADDPGLEPVWFDFLNELGYV